MTTGDSAPEDASPDRQRRARNRQYLQRSTELLWRAAAAPTRGPKPGLTVDQIVTAALTLVDREGVDALSMRRVARELGVGTMTIYRYIPGKAELLDLMVDRADDPSEVIAACVGKGWRERLEIEARHSYEVYMRHPWLMRINWSRPLFGPNTMAAFHNTIDAMTGLPLSGQEKVQLSVLIHSYVTGAARQQIQEGTAADETGITDEEFWEVQYPMLERLLATGDYPALAALPADSFDSPWEVIFEFGLQRVLDGVELLVERRRAAGEPG